MKRLLTILLSALLIPAFAQGVFIEGRTFIAGRTLIMGTGGGSTVSNPIAHYKMNDNAANTTVTDSMGSYNGVATNNTNTLTDTGKINTSLSFNGTSESITLTFITYPAQLTICGWIKTSAAGARTIVAWYGTGNSHTIEWRMGSAERLEFGKYSGTWASVQASSGQLDGGTWIWVCTTVDGTAVAHYVNNSSVGSGTVDKNPTVNATYIAEAVGGSGHWSGEIDDVRIYDFILTEDERAAIYNSGNGTEDQNPAY